MGNLTKNLSRSEFECECGCGFDTVDVALPSLIQRAADSLMSLHHAEKVIVNITGPNRCPSHNRKVGGAPASTHCEARAADHDIELVINGEHVQVPTDELADLYHLWHPQGLGIGRYPNGRVHLDTRTNGPARWDAR